ncbi:MAG: restriction endonuclease subunit S, partial [Gammaproteobacteria bacterium]|nr:restriction endonuclease subunit S [Gammaproteobacteria bacterium]
MQYSIVNVSEVMGHKDKRIDSEHYHPYHLNNLEKFKMKSKCLGDYVLHMSGGATPLGAIYPESGIPFLRVENVMQNYISESNMVYITDEQHAAIARSELKKNDVLLTITGAFGKSAVVTAQFEGSNINQHSVKMTVAGISPHFLAAFLNCKYGYSQSTRHVVGITRPALDYSAVKSFYIPDLSDAFQNVVEYVCLQAETAREDRFFIYHQAQSILLSELGLTNWRPNH